MTEKTKLTLYLDILPGVDLKYVTANSTPGKKTQGFRRFAITIYLPDFNDVDEVLPVHEFKEVDKEAA